MINELLHQLGLGEKETAIYMAVLQQGKITPGNLAKITKINRTTVYSVAKELMQKGLITEDLGAATSYLVARPISDLSNLIEKDEKLLRDKRRIVEKASFELAQITKNVKYAVPKITFIAEENIEGYLRKQTPAWDESIAKYDRTWWGFQDKTFVKYYEKWIDWYWETGGRRDSQLQLLSNESAEAVKMKKFVRRRIKFWNKSADFSATTWILGDYLVMIVTNQRPHYLVEIYDATLAHNQREVFKGLWSSLS